MQNIEGAKESDLEAAHELARWGWWSLKGRGTMGRSDRTSLPLCLPDPLY